MKGQDPIKYANGMILEEVGKLSLCEVAEVQVITQVDVETWPKMPKL